MGKNNKLFELVDLEMLGTSENFTSKNPSYSLATGGDKNVHEETLLMLPCLTQVSHEKKHLLLSSEILIG